MHSELTLPEQETAYFSMEILLNDQLPTYSGGLGALAGDTVLSAADMNVPLVAVTLAHRQGYFRQRLDEQGRQSEEPRPWRPEESAEELEQRVTVGIEDRVVTLRAWRHLAPGNGGGSVPVYLLDSDLPENSDWDRRLTDRLYGGDEYYRLCQEVILGIGGVRMLRALGRRAITRFHMNEGHSAFLTIELLAERARRSGRSTLTAEDLAAVRRHCVFTTHTPVPAGHDKFSEELVQRVLRPDLRLEQPPGACVTELGGRLSVDESGRTSPDPSHPGEQTLNMTYLALNLSHYVNGVAKRHAEVSRHMFPTHSVDAITNGVHWRWVADPCSRLLDRYLPGWRNDMFSLRGALNIPKNEFRQAHLDSKQQLLRVVAERTGVTLAPEVLTIGCARRATPYKRADLIFSDLERLRKLSRLTGPLQLVFAGSAHPRDQGGKALIERIHQAGTALKGDIEVVYLENYDAALAGVLTAGSDLWLNTPLPPKEASGTSGMKAALNGVPSLSVLDGWWLEGHIEGMTGWSVGGRYEQADNSRKDVNHADSLYQKLEQAIIPLYYQEPDRFTDTGRHALALNGSYFNTQRMLLQYVQRAYYE